MRGVLIGSAVPACAAVMLAALAGCGGGSATLTTAATPAAVAGNWKFAAANAPASASQVAALSGSLNVVEAGYGALPSTVQGVVHTAVLGSQSADMLCAVPSEAIAVTGSTAQDGTLTLTSASFGGGSVLTIRGSYDAASRTLSKAEFGIAGGRCAVGTQPMIATQYQPISGTYTGAFLSSNGGPSLAVVAQLTQTSAADANGNFSLQGAGTFQANPCITAPVVTSSTVKVNDITWTYTDAGTGAQVVATGSFDATATTLTISSYRLSGGPAGCSDAGTGTLHK